MWPTLANPPVTEAQVDLQVFAAAPGESYQRIIGLGPRVLPLLLREMENRPHHCVGALRALTGADPVPPQETGQLQRMASRWLDWARATGIRW